MDAQRHTNPDHTDAHGARLERILWWIAGLSTVAMLLAEAFAIPSRYFVNDDYQMLYTAWLRSLGKVPPRDFGVQSYHILPDLLSPFFTIFGRHIETAFYVRVPFLVCMALTAWLAARLSARVLPRIWAPFAMVASLASWPMLERGLDIRPDSISVVLWLWAILLAARPTPAPPTSRFALGAVAGLALALRAKAIVLLPFLAMIVAFSTEDGPRGPRLRLVCIDVGVALVGLLAVFGVFLAYLGIVGEWAHFVQGHLLLSHIARGLGGDDGLRASSFGLLWDHDATLMGLAVVGALALPKWAPSRQAKVLPLALIALIATYVSANVAFYSYNFVLLIPLAAPLIAAGAKTIVELAPPSWRAGLGGVLLAFFPLRHLPLLLGLAAQPTNAHQIAFAHALARTRPDTTVFALEGLGLFRPSLYDWRLSAVSTPLYRDGVIDLRSQLETTQPEIVVLSYRIPSWLKPADARWLTENYIGAAPNVVLHGAVASSARPAILRVVRRQPYRVIHAGCQVDGEARHAREVVWLGRGSHRVESANGRCAVIYDWPALDPNGAIALPYLIPPDATIYESASE
jgi:hypothetical protein